ncbi:5-(carboxyamino)imidazole ribonucleotide synthase [Rhizosphaericola mali]|uniref:N5-carboxyaminoimidazole ribonucleotide synthase n=1 Tax=Rhizosphaericola mali TaxID=2545455 RepID=A0A5P2G1F7_9BACT|nr:5-(carboxyamino)imidazole ribonucleotide synthase [Rhizosphaericola mali]QES89636.1 5-(carboxyamino)imidazole ribonucleotide synthase [Rhizosphaericola mali]
MQKIGILGGGQLGRMLLQAAANYVVETFILENDENCPSAHLCTHFVKGNIQNYDDVYNFGKGLDAITIEIEAVNIDALEALEKEGVKVYPHTSALRTIKNKITQKEFYAKNNIPSPKYVITQNLAELRQHADFLPAVHKIGEGGYDGKGVQVIHTTADMDKGFDAPSVLEKEVLIAKEIAISVAVADNGEIVIYPPAEMVADPVLNLLSYQISPARLQKETLWKAEAIARRVATEFKSPGLFAVEMFLDTNNDVWVNETAPRVHNSGHHTIEGNYSSQFDMIWRILLQYPLGNTDPIMPSSIVNLLGEPGYTGIAKYEGLHEVLRMPNVFVHLYGKEVTKPGRKMGHVTILGNDVAELTFRANKVKNTLKVIAE